MAQNKEQLIKLLQFIKRLIDEPGNDDFVKGLRELLDVPTYDSSSNRKIADIEKYLGLDYKLDSATPDIDYSFIKEDYVREQLVSDYREMLRYRMGVRSHIIDFSEFCRYAMLQVEHLLNYFYMNRFESIEDVIRYINDNAKWTNIEKIDSIKGLSLAAKLSAFSGKMNKRQIEVLDFAREVRNEQSHRSLDETKNLEDFKAKLLAMKLPLTKEGEVYWNGIKDNNDLLLRFNNLDKSAYWKYRRQIWRRREPFGEVVDAIKDMANTINTELLSKI